MRIIALLLWLLYLTLLYSNAHASNAHMSDCYGFDLEKHYIAAYCHGESEVMVGDGSGRVDCLTSTEAQEFDFAKNWHEAIGQALAYGMWTNRTPVVRLIIKPELDEVKYAVRAKAVVDHYQLPVRFHNVYCGKYKY